MHVRSTMRCMRSSIAAAAAAAALSLACAALAIATAAAEEQQQPDCKIVLFRHVEKTGGTSVRVYFKYWEESFDCVGQFCPDGGDGGKSASHGNNLMGLLNAALAHAREEGQAPGLRYFIELHNRMVSRSDIAAILDIFDELRSYGCRVLSFVILREPLEQAISDFHFFPKSYSEFEGNTTAFLLALPENLLRRMSIFSTIRRSGPNSEIVEFDPATYPENYEMQTKLYDRAKKFLRRFDLVGTMDHFSALWRHLCDYMEMDSYPHHSLRVGSAHQPLYLCAEFSNKIANSNKKYSREGMIDDYDRNRELGRRTNPVGYRLWEEFSPAFNSLVHFMKGDSSNNSSHHYQGS